MPSNFIPTPDLFATIPFRSSRRVLYFAFGSNLQRSQMVRRCPSAEAVSTARLDGYRLAFAGYSVSRGGAGVATVLADPYAWTLGVVYSITLADLLTLDSYEGHPHAYRRTPRNVTLLDSDEETTEAFVYIKDDDINLPSEDYAIAILNGYREHGLDLDPLMEALEEASAFSAYY